MIFDLIADQLSKENIGAVFAMVFVLVGLAFKVSAVPFHMWTPDVYEGAPTSITNYFAVVPKVAGLALLIKFMLIPFSNILLEWQTIIIFISIASMILGAVAAITTGAMIYGGMKSMMGEADSLAAGDVFGEKGKTTQIEKHLTTS